ncbi:hypothetical protein Pstr01_20500 [Pseudomonas straminea]|uniref:Uncharacterized protein n=1 Tax=Pseudomonas straminea TaxID=47882 RepID=A0A1I1U314_PSEOC|nr:hypothetical protein [Pseudomonas straminea]GLX13811.1 hypothetical protein Pstr01_20500 [Pseudomonas straminea]SFD65065.1 hypothetical protein SAMN05216372_10310 [Pseudomonas straminea]
MLAAYFVVAQSSGNIIRVTRRDVRPDDSATITHIHASPNQLKCYQRLFDRGQDLISIDSLRQGTWTTMCGNEPSQAFAKRIVKGSLE